MSLNPIEWLKKGWVYASRRRSKNHTCTIQTALKILGSSKVVTAETSRALWNIENLPELGDLLVPYPRALLSEIDKLNVSRWNGARVDFRLVYRTGMAPYTFRDIVREQKCTSVYRAGGLLEGKDTWMYQSSPSGYILANMRPQFLNTRPSKQDEVLAQFPFPSKRICAPDLIEMLLSLRAEKKEFHLKKFFCGTDTMLIPADSSALARILVGMYDQRGMLILPAHENHMDEDTGIISIIIPQVPDIRNDMRQAQNAPPTAG